MLLSVCEVAFLMPCVTAQMGFFLMLTKKHLYEVSGAVDADTNTGLLLFILKG